MYCSPDSICTMHAKLFMTCLIGYKFVKSYGIFKIPITHKLVKISVVCNRIRIIDVKKDVRCMHALQGMLASCTHVEAGLPGSSHLPQKGSRKYKAL